jgi:glycosyltransferase involved in cell wall biosynthesis
MTVAAALIVKNEEAMLGRCLESIAGHVDEIVIVDTGSTDATKEIASRFTDRIFDFEWVKDFAAARQHAFGQATSDWVFWIDADDVVKGADSIRRVTEQAAPSLGLIYWKYVIAWDPYGNVTCEYWRERCARGGKGRWAGRIHETLMAEGGTLYSDHVIIEHHPEPGEDNLVRNVEIMELALKEEGNQARLLFYLGRDYSTMGETDKAIDAFQRYVPLATWDDERYQAFIFLADLFLRKESWNEAIDANLVALKVQSSWPDAYFGLAKTYYFVKDWPRAVHWSELGEMMAEPKTLAIINPMDYRFNWIIYYTNALYHVGRIEDALHWTREALSLAPNDPWHKENEALFSGMVKEK